MGFFWIGTTDVADIERLGDLAAEPDSRFWQIEEELKSETSFRFRSEEHETEQGVGTPERGLRDLDGVVIDAGLTPLRVVDFSTTFFVGVVEDLKK